VRVDPLQLIHNGTDVLYAFRHFDTHGFFDANAQSMAVLMGRPGNRAGRSTPGFADR
jgi:hypothetical protein